MKGECLSGRGKYVHRASITEIGHDQAETTEVPNVRLGRCVTNVPTEEGGAVLYER